MWIRRDGSRRHGVVIATTVMLSWAGSVLPAVADDVRPSGTVSEQQAVAAALAYDPALAAFGFEERARTARARQEGRLPNPTLATEVENVARFGGDSGGAEAAQATVSVTQVLELGGKRGRRVAVAERDATLAHWDLVRARLDTTARARRAFVAALLAQERVGLAARRRDLARDGLAAARRYRDAGSGSAADVARAEALLAQQEALVARREREGAAARAALAATWGGGERDVAGLAGGFGPLPPPAELVALRAAAATQPDVARFGDAIARGEADVGLEAARRMPDVAVRVGARRFIDAGGNALVAEVSVPLPLFDRNADAIAEAEARLAKTRAERRAAEAAAEAALRAEYAELRSSYDEAGTLALRVVPRLTVSLGETRRAYAAGTVRLLEVVDAERALADAEEERLAALARFHTAAVEIERLTGVAVTGGAR